MDPITEIVTALAVGAAAGTADTASSAVKDAYAGLKALVAKRLSGRQDAAMVLSRHEAAPEVWRAPLAAELAGAGADRDIDLVRAAQALMTLAEAAGITAGKYAVDARGAQGVQVGDHTTQDNVFHAPPDGLAVPGADHAVDARGAMGVQIGVGSTQIIYSYNRLTWTDGIAPPPLISVSGMVDSPYRGLGAFEERDAAFFFGREAAAADVLDRMSRCADEPGLLVVSGVSGAGKSSLLRAGVLARIRGAGLASVPGSASWPCLVFTPGHAPLNELAVGVASLAGADAGTVRSAVAADPAGFALTARQAALARPADAARDQGGRRLLIVVDQFEQLFTQCPDEEQRRAFITALLAAATTGQGPDQVPSALVVLGVRADFEARCASYAELADAVQHRYLVTAMTGRQLRMVITEPAKMMGAQVDDDLVEVLLREAASRQPTASAGVLPLLSHALDQAWRGRVGDVLSLADYERTGGIEGAVGRSAERAYSRLTAAQQAAARRIFTRLTATTSDGADTAARATRAELIEGKDPDQARDAEAVLEAFAAERLLTLAAGTVEISHEVLLTAWPLLRDTWLAETHADRIVRTRLGGTATEWARHGRDPSYLYGGSLLETAAGAAARIDTDPARHLPLSPADRDFLWASARAHRRRTRRRQCLIALLTALVVGLAAVAAVAFAARQDAVDQRDIAVSSGLGSRSEVVGDADPRIAKLLSVAAWRIHRSDDARYAMLTAAALPGIGILTGHAAAVYSVAFSPDGKTLASCGADNTIRLWDVATGRQIDRPFARHPRGVFAVAFSPAGKTLASYGADHTIRLWDVATGRQTGRSLTGHAGQVTSVAFSPDGKTLASGSDDGTIRLWDAATGRQIGSLTGQAGPVWSVAFGRRGKILASGGFDGSVRLWDVATRRQIGSPLTGLPALPAFPVLSVAFSPDGKTLASGNFGSEVRLWDVGTGRLLGNLRGHKGIVWSVAFSSDGKTLASGSDDHTIRLWDAATASPIGSLTGHASQVTSVAFSSDGKTLASGSDDHTIRLWHVTSGRPIGNPVADGADPVNSMAYSPDGKTLADGGGDGTIRLWDAATGRLIDGLGANADPVDSVAFSRDSRTLASGGGDGTIRLWDAATGRLIDGLRANAGPVDSVAFSRDSRTLASGGDDRTIRLWDVATGRQVGVFRGHADTVLSVAFSPDGKILASGSKDGTIRLWQVATGRPIGTLGDHNNAVNSVTFSPDGKTLASGLDDHTVRLWDVATGRPRDSPLTGHLEPVSSVAFSPDGKTLASGSGDETVRLWDVATYRPIGSPLTDHATMVNAVAFSPDGKTLASGLDDHTVRLWDVAYTADVAAYLCVTASPPLTPAEWTHWVPPPGPAYRPICP